MMERKILAVLAVALILPAAAVGSDTIIVKTTKADCTRLVQHVARADVAYKAGTDVRGRKVAPADLPGTNNLQIQLPETYEFPISFNPLRGDTGNRFAETTLDVGKIKYNLKTGTASYNGQPLTDPAQAELSRQCQKIMRQ